MALPLAGGVLDVSGAGAGGAVVNVRQLSGVAGSEIRLGSGLLMVSESTAGT